MMMGIGIYRLCHSHFDSCQGMERGIPHWHCMYPGILQDSLPGSSNLHYMHPDNPLDKDFSMDKYRLHYSCHDIPPDRTYPDYRHHLYSYWGIPKDSCLHVCILPKNSMYPGILRDNPFSGIHRHRRKWSDNLPGMMFRVYCIRRPCSRSGIPPGRYLRASCIRRPCSRSGIPPGRYLRASCIRRPCSRSGILPGSCLRACCTRRWYSHPGIPPGSCLHACCTRRLCSHPGILPGSCLRLPGML